MGGDADPRDVSLGVEGETYHHVRRELSRPQRGQHGPDGVRKEARQRVGHFAAVVLTIATDASAGAWRPGSRDDTVPPGSTFSAAAARLAANPRDAWAAGARCSRSRGTPINSLTSRRTPRSWHYSGCTTPARRRHSRAHGPLVASLVAEHGPTGTAVLPSGYWRPARAETDAAHAVAIVHTTGFRLRSAC